MSNHYWFEEWLLSAFTLILPLFPALIGHYRDNDSSGLFAYLETKVLTFKENMNWLGIIPIHRLMASVSWWEPQLNSTQCCLAAFWAVFSHFFRWQMYHAHYVITIDFSVPGKSNHWRPQWSLREKTPAVDVDSWYDIILLNSDLYCEFTVLSGIALSYLLWVFSSNFTIFVMARIPGGISKG